MTAKLSTWKPEHLSLWVDLVEVPKTSPGVVPTPAEMIEIEDQAQAAKFREVRAKISQDILDMTNFNSKQDESKRRGHVVTVMHEKAQMAIGKQFLVHDNLQKRLLSNLVCFWLFIVLLAGLWIRNDWHWGVGFCV